MDSMKSFKGYGKVDEAEEQAFRKRTRCRLLILAASAALLLAVVVAAVAGALVHRRNSSGHDGGGSSAAPSPELTPAASLKAVCSISAAKTVPRHHRAHAPPDNYTLALRKALMFFNAQCSGKLRPVTRPDPTRALGSTVNRVLDGSGRIKHDLGCDGMGAGFLKPDPNPNPQWSCLIRLHSIQDPIHLIPKARVGPGYGPELPKYKVGKKAEICLEWRRVDSPHYPKNTQNRSSMSPTIENATRAREVE
ncbi:hypothetical protein NL676_004181 [Syzygium grande]|nr:hypothetical protein NL676_004181 [Syzygium grande]